MSGQAGIDLLRHQLRVFGLPASVERDIDILYGPDRASLAHRHQGRLLIAVLPDAEFVAELGGRWLDDPCDRHFAASDRIGVAPRTLFESQAYECEPGKVLLSDVSRRAVWFYADAPGGGVVVIGTNLIGDLSRYRQGDPARARSGDDSGRWGFSFERPNYLYDSQRDVAAPRRCYADEWAWLLTCSVADALRVKLEPMLPGGSRGALVITGDDDQALLEKYATQRSLLRGLPCTYFMHPLTKHSRRTVREMFDRRVELALHPDALDAPATYAQQLSDQARWFSATFGASARSVRNHGFLNDGYWGHLPAWQAAGLEFSSNIPGVDGSVLTGSLIPTRVMTDQELTSHWSILTAFGDGMVFALGMSDEEAAGHMRAVGREVLQSRFPGVLVINLHPQNVDETRAMHEAVQQMILDGFLPWNMRECLDWFKAKDKSGGNVEASGLIQRLWARASRLVKSEPT